MEKKLLRIWPRLALACLMLFCLLPSRALAATNFEAALDHDTISTGESAMLTLTFVNCSPAADLNFQIPGLQVSNRRTQSSFNFDNGRQYASEQYSYELRASKEGTYVIPALKVQLNNGQLGQSKPLVLKVQKGALPTNPGGAEPAFVKLVVPRQQIFIGETIPVSIECYCQDAGNLQRPQLDASGFTTSGIGDYDKPYRRVQINGQIYNQLIFHAAVTPAKIGLLDLGPATWGLTILFGPRDSWGNFSQQRNVNLSSQTVPIQVLALPTNGVPPGFNGAIGTYTLASFEAGPTNVAVGDPITLKIRIAGSGAFDSLNLQQDPAEWQDFKTYPAASSFDTKDPLQIEGSKYFEQVILPQNTSVKAIPAFTFSFFDPIQKSYLTLSHPAIPITVRPTVAAPQPTVLQAAPQQTEAPAPRREIAHIKPLLGNVSRVEPPLLLQPRFLVLQAIAPILWIGAVFWRKRKESLANNPKLLRQRAVDRLVRRELASLPALARANKKDEFYATVFRLLQEVLGEKLDLPASAITEAALNSLPGDNAELVTQARQLFHSCDQYRYAPAHGSEELEAIVSRVEAVVSSLRKIESASVNKATAALASCLLALILGTTAHAQSTSQAQDANSAFSAANRLYEQNKFVDAANAYEKLIQSGLSSPALFFNAGNAWFKAAQPGRAILAYRTAHLLAPRDPDILANLRFTRAHVGTVNPPSSGGKWVRLLDRMSLNEWTLLASGVTALFFISLAFGQLAPNRSKLPRWPFLALGATTLICICCFGAIAKTQLGDKVSVVIVPESVVRRGPFTESPTVFTARDGTELLVVGSLNDWLEVADSTGHTGWLPGSDVVQAR